MTCQTIRRLHAQPDDTAHGASVSPAPRTVGIDTLNDVHGSAMTLRGSLQVPVCRHETTTIKLERWAP